jgi:hypothetical protein
MEIAEFEHGKTCIMAAAREALRRHGIDQHSLMFDLHRTHPHPEGATLTVSAGEGTVHGWFSAQEIHDSRQGVDRSEIRRKIASLVAGLTAAVA